MKFSALTLLALSASASAYVVNDKKVVTGSAVEARVVGSGPVRASALVAAMQARNAEPHHKGKGRKANNKREEDLEDQEADDAHWADLHTREPHHKGKGRKNQRGVEVEAREPHHKGKGRKANNKREEDLDQEADDAHWADLHTREPHHKGKGRKANNKRDVDDFEILDEPEDEFTKREPHHKGKGKKANNKREEVEEFDQAADDAHFADLHTRSPHHKGKGKKANNKREEEEFDQAADDAHYADLHARAPHHKGKGKKAGN